MFKIKKILWALYKNFRMKSSNQTIFSGVLLQQTVLRQVAGCICSGCQWPGGRHYQDFRNLVSRGIGIGAWQGAWQRNFAEQNGSELFRVLTPQSPPAEGMISKGALKGLRLNRSIRPQAQLVNKNDEKSAINNAQVTHAKCINTCRT